MDDTNRGRGAFIYMSILTASLFIIFIIAYFFVDISGLVQGDKTKPGLMEAASFIWISCNLVFLFWNSSLVKGVKRTLLAFVITTLIAFVAEGLGVHYGLVFGHYHYTNLLGYSIWAIPIIVCLAWEPILYAAYCITEYLIPSVAKPTSPLQHRILSYVVLAFIGGIATTAWDLMVDPFAVHQGWWIWEQGGSYMSDIGGGVPFSNFFGWWKVAFLCHLVYQIILNTGPEPHRSKYITVYGPMMLYINLFLGAVANSLVILKRTDLFMIGLMCMGTLIFIMLARILLSPGLNLSLEKQQAAFIHTSADME